MSATSNCPSTSTTSRGNISVTNINCENVEPNASTIFNNVGIRIKVPKMEESDESDSELSNIEKTSKVNMKTDERTKAIPRPMSWEGDQDLSEPEAMMIDNENSVHDSNMKPIAHEISNKIKMNDFHDNIYPLALTNKNHTTILPTNMVKPEIGVSVINPGPSFTATISSSTKKLSDIINLKYEHGIPDTTVTHSPLLVRSKSTLLPANPSPDSAIHSVYTHSSSPSQSPLTSRHAPYTPSLSRNNSDASAASHSSCYSYSSEFSPTHSPIQGRHAMYSVNSYNGSPLHHSVLYKPLMDGDQSIKISHDGEHLFDGEHIPSAGISRQQLINSPCPICGDKISGFHYGIFSCESCKGFFKRTVQNRKNYVCLRGAACPVTIATRKKCPACRFDKCLQKGMKLEAIREDRTRGGRSTYQCSYTLPGTILSPQLSNDSNGGYQNARMSYNGPQFKMEIPENGGNNSNHSTPGIPTLLQEIMDVEHLWQYNAAELSRLNQPAPPGSSASIASNPLLSSAGISNDSNPDLIANLCNIADHRLYKIVKWCKSLPLFKNISIDDQICLLINSWCELLLFSCCFRSMLTPGEIRISHGKSITLEQARNTGLQACIERMLNLTDHLRRLRVDHYEYVAMKVIVLMTSDTSELKEAEKVRASQEKALQALQAYTLAHYPDTPAKFGELLLRIPELQRTCQVGKEMLTIKAKDGEEEPSFNLLMELLRGEH